MSGSASCPGIVNGRDRWCQGFSEPDAGSDLASLRTRADRDGDEYVLTGHKVWTSYSDDADWCLVLARTDHDVAKHKGISAFAVPMRQAGIEQRPLPMINGITKEFGEVRFDGARVPAGNMIGGPGEGWALAMTVVSHEREPHELGFAGRYAKQVMDLTAQVRAGPGRTTAPNRCEALAWAIVESEMLRLHVYRRLSDRSGRHLPRSRGFGRQAPDDLHRADRGPCRAGGGWSGCTRGRRHLVQGVSVQPGPERHGGHVTDPAQPGGGAHPGVAGIVTYRPDPRAGGRGGRARPGRSG